MRYAVVIEKAGGNYSGYVPDLPDVWPPGRPCRLWRMSFVRRSDFTWRD
jgi:hypothetical protein